MTTLTTAKEKDLVASTLERVRGLATGRSRPTADPDTTGAAPADHPANAESAAMRFLRSVPEAPEMPSATATRRPRTSRRMGGRSLFAAMVATPMVLVLAYLLLVATPLYEARSVIAITASAEGQNEASVGLMGRPQAPRNLHEVFRIATYLHSQVLMARLEEDLGLVSELSGPAMDPVRRLRAIPLLSTDTHDRFDSFVEASIDVQSGLLTLHVRAPEPERALEVSDFILREVRQQVTALGQSVFDTRQAYAAEARSLAEARVQEAQARLIALQVEHQEVDPRTHVKSIYARIQELEEEARSINTEIQKAQIAGISGTRQIENLTALETHLREEIGRERAKLVSPDGSSATPLNNLLMEYEMAELEVELAREAVISAIEAQAEAGRQAALNRSLLQVVVPPSASAVAVLPNIPGVLLLCLVLCLVAFTLTYSFTRFSRR